MSAAASLATPASDHKERPHRRIAILFIIAAIVSVAVLIVIGMLGQRDVNAGDPDSYGPRGTRALATILREQGVDVTVARSSVDAVAAMKEHPQATLLVQGSALAPDVLATTTAAATGDIIAVAPDPWMVDALLDADADATRPPRSVACPAFAAEQRISARERRGAYPSGSEVTACVPMPARGGAPGNTGYALITSTVDGHDVSIVAAASMLENTYLDQQDNAAVALKLLGTQSHLVWFVPGPADLYSETSATQLASMPREYFAGLAGIAVLAVAALLCWGRRFGRLVVEPLPVIVPQLETTLGRARLYQRSRDLEHASRILRTASRVRLCKGLHLPHSYEPRDLVRAVAARTQVSETDVQDLLYSAPVVTEVDLVQLAQDLLALEDRIRP